MHPLGVLRRLSLRVNFPAAVVFTDSSNVAGPVGEFKERVDRAELEARPVRVAFAAVPTLLSIADAACGRDAAVPTRWVRSARRALTERDLELLQPLVTRPNGFVPDCLVPLPTSDAEAEPTRTLRQIAETAGEALPAELNRAGAPGFVGPWRAVGENPRGWAIRYARALLRIWTAVQVEIRGASALIDREIERVGSAAARGTLPPLLSELHPGSSVTDGSWMIPAAQARTLRLPERGLVLAPKIAGPGSSLIRAYDGTTLTHLVYPVPGATRALDDRGLAPSSLEALVGAQRSTILRRLDCAQTIGTLAETLVSVPGTATHHVDALESAGLVVRERKGRQVLVRRTARGSAILALYEKREIVYRSS